MNILSVVINVPVKITHPSPRHPSAASKQASWQSCFNTLATQAVRFWRKVTSSPLPLQAIERRASQCHFPGSAHSSSYHHSWPHAWGVRVWAQRSDSDKHLAQQIPSWNLHWDFLAGPVKNALKSPENRLSQEISGRSLFLAGTGRPLQSSCHACPLQELPAGEVMARRVVGKEQEEPPFSFQAVL